MPVEQPLHEHLEILAGLHHQGDFARGLVGLHLDHGFDQSFGVEPVLVETPDAEPALAVDVDVHSAVLEVVDLLDPHRGAHQVGLRIAAHFVPGSDEHDAKRPVVFETVVN